MLKIFIMDICAKRKFFNLPAAHDVQQIVSRTATINNGCLQVFGTRLLYIPNVRQLEMCLSFSSIFPQNVLWILCPQIITGGNVHRRWVPTRQSLHTPNLPEQRNYCLQHRISPHIFYVLWTLHFIPVKLRCYIVLENTCGTRTSVPFVFVFKRTPSPWSVYVFLPSHSERTSHDTVISFLYIRKHFTKWQRRNNLKT
jgi:hypothetical protein